jgi:hypothetical protein
LLGNGQLMYVHALNSFRVHVAIANVSSDYMAQMQKRVFHA